MSGLSKVVRAKPEDVSTEWVCPDCGSKVSWTVADLCHDGTPVCAECDCDMVLDDEKVSIPTDKAFIYR